MSLFSVYFNRAAQELDDGLPVLNTKSQNTGDRGGSAQVWHSFLQMAQT